MQSVTGTTRADEIAQKQAKEAAVSADRDGAMHKNGHDTEATAAASIRPTSGYIRARVMKLLREHPDGLTDDEGAELLKTELASPWVDRLTFGRRRCELYNDGLVYKTSGRRPSRTGRPAIVWKADPS